MLTRTGLTIILLLYLVMLSITLGFVGATFGDVGTYYTTSNQTIGFSYLGNDGSFLQNIVTSVTILPLWIDILLLIIPVGLLVYIVVLSFIPGNAGS